MHIQQAILVLCVSHTKVCAHNHFQELKNQKQWLANNIAHPPGYVENHFPETQAKDQCPSLPEKYNHHVIRQVEKKKMKATVQYEFVIIKCRQPFSRNSSQITGFFLLLQLNSHLLQPMRNKQQTPSMSAWNKMKSSLLQYYSSELNVIC